MKNGDLTQCGSIYTHAFPMEYWGTDWTTENDKEYLQDYFEQRRFVGFVYEENKEVLGCIFALRKISGSKEEIYINEMAVLLYFPHIQIPQIFSVQNNPEDILWHFLSSNLFPNIPSEMLLYKSNHIVLNHCFS